MSTTADAEVIRCPNCGAANRVPRAKIARGLQPVCGLVPLCHVPGEVRGNDGVLNLVQDVCLSSKLFGEDSPLRLRIVEIRKAAERAASLTQQLLAFSRKQVLQRKSVNLNDIVSATELMLRRLLGENITLTLRLAPNLEPITADPSRMDQVIINLAVNARDAMPEAGELIVETANVLVEPYEADARSLAAGSYVMLRVTDTGTGMDAFTQSRIFEPFFTTKQQGKGTGLGLSTVQGIVDQTGGNISVTSEIGKGTTFRIYFPRQHAGS